MFVFIELCGYFICTDLFLSLQQCQMLRGFEEVRTVFQWVTLSVVCSRRLLKRAEPRLFCGEASL